MTGGPARYWDALLRPGRSAPGDVRRDVLWLVFAGLVLFAVGLGLRDPWPADEPRFALIGRDMVATGQWLFPRVGGDLYQDKPPVFFWAIASGYWLTDSLRIAFLLPSLLAGIGTVLLVYDLARRVWSRDVGLAAGLLLVCSVQIVVQARAAQIDMLLTFFTTAALYGICRHLFTGPDWRAYALGGFAAGIGVITKGTGFLPLLLVLPFLALRRQGFSGLWAGAGGARWWLAPAAALAGIALWFVPMILGVELSGDPALRAYRDEILLKQTVTRYAAAWHHHSPWYYFIVAVIPAFWLPGTALLPWLAGRWRAAWAARDGRVWVLLLWIVLVVTFFSISPGKRGVYVLPALPAFALACAPWLHELMARRNVQRTLFVISLVLVLVSGLAALYVGVIRPEELAELGEKYGVTSVAPLGAIALAGAAGLAWLRPARGAAAWALVLALIIWTQGLWINPMINDARSGRSFVEAFEARVPAGAETGLVAYREQYLIYITRPITNFGHRRSTRDGQEADDAARWLNDAANRVLVVDDRVLAACFTGSPATAVGHANRRDWFVVRPPANEECARRGDPAAALTYQPYSR